MRTKDEKKRLAIRDATIAEVVAGGLAGASIARIANRAKLSQGTIYLYYTSKEVLIRQVYVETKLEMRDALMASFNDNASSEDNIRTLWHALLNYALDQPKRFAFTEYITAANLFQELEAPALAEVEREFKSIITNAISNGTLKPAPYEALQAILVAPVSHLARKAALADEPISKTTRNTTFDLIWHGISTP